MQDTQQGKRKQMTVNKDIGQERQPVTTKVSLRSQTEL